MSCNETGLNYMMLLARDNSKIQNLGHFKTDRNFNRFE